MTAALAGRAAAIAGDRHVMSDPRSLDRYTVDNVRPTAVARPATPEETAALLVAAGEDRSGVLPWGGGAHQHLGGIPTRADLVVDTARLRGITDYTPEDYVVAVRAGTPFQELQAALAEHGQWLPLDPPGVREATIGGLIAANRNGPRRLLWGSIRDQLIGIRVALPTGEVIKAGGKVVKNVAGYDLTKLFIGSLGSAGIITEATFKISPRPGDGLTIRISVPGLAAAADLTRAVMRSFLLPSAIEVANPPACGRLATEAGLEPPRPDEWEILLLVEGLEESRNRHIEELRTITGTHGRMEILRGPAHEMLWQTIAEFPSPGTHPGRIICRAGGPIARWPDLAAAVGALPPACGPIEVLAHAGVGLFYAACAAPDGYMVVDALGRGTAETGGYTVVEVAPTMMKAQLPMWGSPPGAVDLMRRLRETFDPRGVMIPGRLGWGL